MSKGRVFSKLIKFIVTMLVYGVKMAVTVVRQLIATLFRGISKRLRFSITFKTATFYSFIFSAIFMILSIVLAGAFGGFLLFEAKNDLTKDGQVAVEFLKQGTNAPTTEIKNFAKTEGIIIALLNKDQDVTYITEGEPADIPAEAIYAPSMLPTFDKVYVKIAAVGIDQTKYVIVSKSLLKEKAYLLVLLATLAVSFPLAILLSVILGARILKKMLRPIDSMINTARSVSATDLNTRLNVVNSHDELKELAETFNEMLDRIQKSYEQQHQFVSDASHELRTPISVIQGYANLLERWGKEEKEVLDESVCAIKNEADNMKDLVEKLLFLARADKDTQKLERTNLQLNELIEEVLKETRLIDAEHQILNERNDPVTIQADRALIKQALRVFIDNSIKYTPMGGAIKVDSQLSQTSVKIIIEDTGIGIPKEDIPYVFNRFYKCDKSRTRGAGGTGLGLSIAKWIIEKHNGTISLDSTLGKGTKMIINLPT